MSFVSTIRNAALATVIATGASAATMSLEGTATGTHVLQAPGTFPDGYDLLAPAIGTVLSYFSNADKNASNGLSVSGPARVTYTYVGSEAGYQNYALYVLGTLFQNFDPGSTSPGDSVTVSAGGGLLDFAFGTVAPATLISNNGGASGSGIFAIAYAQISATTWYAFFDDSAQHSDFDDLVIRIDVAPIPLPAGGLLLIGALGGLAALRRRKTA